MKYVITDLASVEPGAWSEVFESDETARKSLKNNVVLKFRGATPVQLEGLTVYTRGEILEEMNKPEWTIPKPVPAAGEE